MSYWNIVSEAAEQVLRTASHTAQEYDAHRQRLDAAVSEVLAALPGSRVVAASVDDLAERALRPQLGQVVSDTNAALQGTRCAVDAYREAEAQMARHGDIARARLGAGADLRRSPGGR
ncbi:MAG: DUF6507 family protein [Ornithinimicrobium sp.]